MILILSQNIWFKNIYSEENYFLVQIPYTDKIQKSFQKSIINYLFRVFC